MEFEAPDWRALHSSLSRRRRFAFCPVGYYLYHVPGRDGYAEHPDDWAYKVYAAKHVISAASWVTAVFRTALRDYFRMGTNFRRRKFENAVRAVFEHRFNELQQRHFELDPKIVPAVLEIECGVLSGEDFYDRALYQLNDAVNAFMQSWVFSELMTIPMLDFRAVESSWQPWQLGGINFFNPPDLIWKSSRSLHILDLNRYFFEYELADAALLYRVYAARFMSIPAASVLVNFWNRENEIQSGCESDPDLRTLFQQLTGEAAMWRDHLIKQAADASGGVWHYAQLDKCRSCRFNACCPAHRGTGGGRTPLNITE